MREPLLILAAAAFVALGLATPRPARAADREAQPPDAQLLLDLDLLREVDLAREGSLFTRMRILERMRLLEALPVLESQPGTPLPDPAREVK